MIHYLWIVIRFFGFLLINTSLKLHYKSIHTSAHKWRANFFETLGLFTTLLMVWLSSSSSLIIFSPHSFNLRYSFPPFTQSQPTNVSQLAINNPPLTKSLNLSVNPIPLTQNSPHYLIHDLCTHTHQNLSLILAALSWDLSLPSFHPIFHLLFVIMKFLILIYYYYGEGHNVLDTMEVFPLCWLNNNKKKNMIFTM